MTEIYQAWVDFGIDGFRIDTVKHVNVEFWQAFAAAIADAGRGRGQRRLLRVRRGVRRQPGVHVALHDRGRPAGDARLRLPGQGQRASPRAARPSSCATCSPTTTTTPTPTPTPTRCRRSSATTTWAASAGSSPTAAPPATSCCARDRLAHSLMYLSRGQPVVYYGDEQGFVGDGGDKDARQDMFPSQVASYNDDDLIGTDATTADANFDTDHPLYRHLADLSPPARGAPGAGRRRPDPPLRQRQRRRVRVQPHRRRRASASTSSPLNNSETRPDGHVRHVHASTASSAACGRPARRHPQRPRGSRHGHRAGAERRRVAGRRRT